MAKFASKLTDRQMQFARLIADNGIDSISQVVKAMERRDDKRIAEYKEQLAIKEAAGQLVRR
jgi:hypothetical protein